MRQSLTSPLNAAVQKAGRKLSSLLMTEIVGAADKIDADNLIDDLDHVCRIVDELILTIGKYAQEHIGVTPSEVEEHFTDQLRNALEGNGMYAIDCAGKMSSEYAQEQVARFRRTFQQAAE